MLTRALVGVLSAALLAGVAGCAAIPGLGTAGSPEQSQTKRDGKVLQLPEKTAFQQGQAVEPDADTPVTGASRQPLASLPPLPESEPEPAPEVVPAECTGRILQGVRNGLTVVPTATSATVTWYDVGDPALVEYQLAAVSQDFITGQQPAWPWISVTRSKPCTEVTATVTGLTPQTAYIFVLHAVLERYESLPPTAPEVARSSPVRTI